MGIKGDFQKVLLKEEISFKVLDVSQQIFKPGPDREMPWIHTLF